MTDVDWEKVNAKRKAAQERKLARMATPEYKEKQLAKRQEQAVKAEAKAKAKLSDPEYKQRQIDKASAARQRAFERLKAKDSKKIIKSPSYPKQKTPKYNKSSKGLKGRTPTAVEKRLMNKIGALPCICCVLKGAEVLDSHQHGPITLHHVEGRTKPWAHARVLPLCQYHHDVPAPLGAPVWLFPLHGNGRKPWELENGTQEALLDLVYDIIGETQPWAVLEALPLS